ncbi:DUF4892 domain-containing protein [Neptuniibacter pectenicola]|jgi:hypothetical protein|uniref:DUF4892 domain-containing protein n=1 Tax=Neptuniibacter pectenicola TaxID=1806669 RepID=UPI0008311022|nr:DUF4892 domain-containing protein [Neptuniibacter pectenicola]
MRTLVVFLYILFCSVYASAETDLPNSSDYPQLLRFPGSYIVQYDQGDENYRLVLGSLQKVNGVVIPEKEQRLTGWLTQITYRIPEPSTPDEAFSMFEAQLTKRGATTLFKCSGRDCGSSNQWANTIFRYSRLYGVEESQSFAAFRLNNKYVSLYAVERGNKRVYLRLDVLVENIMGLDGQVGEGDGIPFTGNASELQALVAYLNANPEQNVWLVGHDLSGQTRQQQLDKAKEKLLALQLRLIEQNISSDRINVYSLGGFAATSSAEILVFIE